jgi:hypothetical protein
MPAIPPILGQKVSTRVTSWADLAHRAWGSDFYIPDPDIYRFSNGRGFLSTDKFKTGIYGVDVSDPLVLDGQPYPDMRVALEVAPAPGVQFNNQVMPAGYHDEIGKETGSPLNTNLDPARQYPL